ncbi:hypothetical protein BSKO_02511 [Bryopsis sp. KO-2023]|nr:hypothetical protein BSKO_02511 [Bryopsis sp. KO-2023]
MSKLFASALLILVLSTVGVTSRPLGFGTAAIAADRDASIEFYTLPWCRSGHGYKENMNIFWECVYDRGISTETGDINGEFRLCCHIRP